MLKKLQRSISMVLILALVITNMIGMIMPETAVADNVLTVAEAIANNSGTATVEGYIVGHTAGGSGGSANYNFQAPFANDYNFAIADSADETQSEKIMPIQLTSSYRAQFGLKTNPDLIGKKVRVTGSLETYFTVPALKSPSAIEIIQETSTELQIDYSSPVTSADAYSTVTVNFSVAGSVYAGKNTVTASVYAKEASAQAYTVTEAVYSEDDGAYIYCADIRIGTENVQYYIEAVDAEGKTDKTDIYEIQVNSYEDKNDLLKLVGRFTAEGADGKRGVAEIVKYDKASKKSFVVNGAEDAVSVDIVDLSGLDTSSGNVGQLALSHKISINDLPDFGDGFTAGDITCIDIHPSGQYFAVSLPSDTRTDHGRVAFFAIDAQYTYRGFVEVGALPDNLTFTPDGNTLLVANEGEPNDDYTIDPEGSVSIIDVSGGVESIAQESVFTASFEGVTVDTDVVIKDGAQVKNDMEPEYIVVDQNNQYAYVALQENNAVAKLDIANKTFTKVYALGAKDFSVVGLDAVEDGEIEIRNWPLLGMYMPDGMDIASINGSAYVFTANEGDAREYDEYENELKIKKADLALDAAYYAGYTQDELDALALKDLDDYKIHKELGINSDEDYEALYAYGARSFSIWDASDFHQVYDSGAEFEKITAAKLPDYFNASNDNADKDDRSANKGPEPEDVKVGKVGDKYYAFIGLERIGGIMVYDVTDPANAEFVQYITTRDFSGNIAGDCAPEGIKFVPAEDSPVGKPLVLVANEVSGTLSVFEVKYQAPADGVYNLYAGQLHSHTNFSDGQGTPQEAFAWARDQGDADFFAVTDHSNWFDDEKNKANENITDVSQSTSQEWKDLHTIADSYTVDGQFIGIAGFEMTWSDGTGHINTFNTPWFGSRSNSKMNLQAYYDKIKGTDSINQLNHPGKTFGDFNDFGYYSAEADAAVHLIEVGNGEGPIRGTGYYPSYEYYTRALDKGWHVAPSNNQDNHYRGWITANEARTVVLAPSLTREDIFDAIRNLRVYATEDRNLRISYKVNGDVMGATVGSDEDLNFEISVEDPDIGDQIGKISVIADGGTVVTSKEFTGNTANWTFTLEPQYSYYYVRIDQEDQDIAVTAPIWTGEVVPVGLSKVEVSQNPTIEGEQIQLTATAYNNGNQALSNINVEFYADLMDNKIGEQTISSIAAGETGTAQISWTAAAQGNHKIYAKAVMPYDGIDKVFTISTNVEVLDPEDAKKVVIDAGHYNAYISGYYEGRYEGLTRVLGEKGMTTYLNNDELTADDLQDAKILIVSDPMSYDDNYGAKKSYFSESEITVIKDFVNAGGSLIITSRADYGEGSTEQIYQNSVQGNSVLEAIGSNLRFNDDEIEDTQNNDGLTYRLMLDNYVSEKYDLTELEDPSLKFRIYSSCSVILKDGGSDKKVDWLIKVHDTTVSNDTDNSGDNKSVTPGNFHALAVEELAGGGKVAAAGCTFFSDFEIAADNLHSNEFILGNMLEWMAPESAPEQMTIRGARVDENNDGTPDLIGETVTVEGYVTSESEAYTKAQGRNNAFFEVMYIQDETGGITVFGISQKEIALGTRVKVTGEIEQYNGDTEIDVDDEANNVVILDTNANVITPELITTADSMKEDNEGWLAKVQGTVTRMTNDSLYLDDGTGEARVFVEGYIDDGSGNPAMLGKWDSSINVGDLVSAIGLVSQGTEGHRLRVRNTAEIKKVTQPAGENKIIIVHTNDVHGRVEEGNGMGVAKATTKIKELEAANPGRVLVLDAGDTFHGQTIISLSKGEAMVDIMNEMGYDAMAAGNHDFNYGQERLVELDDLANFPILSANVVKEDESTLLTPYTIKDIGSKKVAIFGLSTPETTYKTHPKNVEGLTFKDPVTVAQQMVEKLKDQSDVIIALAHIGLDESSEVTSEDIANAVTGIDVIVDGHSHTPLSQGKLVNGTLIVQTGEYLGNLGIVELSLDEDGSISRTAQLLTAEQAASLAADEEMTALIAQLKAENEQITSLVIGHTDVTLDGERQNVRTGETNLGNLIADAMKDAAGADVALTNGGGIRASIDVGDITKGEIITVLPFGNYVALKEVSGADLLAALELGVSAYPATLGGFPHISGMRVVFNPAAEPLNRVVSVTIDGKALDIHKTYKLATNDFLAAGGDNYTMFADDAVIGEYPALDEVVADYINKNGMKNAVVDGRMSTSRSGSGSDDDDDDDSSGDSDSGGGQSTNNTQNPDDVSQSNGTIQVSAPEVDSNGAAVADVDQETMDKAIQDAQDNKIVIEVPQSPGASKISTKLPAASLQNAKESNIEAIEIHTELASIVMAPDALAIQGTSSSQVEVSVEKVNTADLPQDVQEKVEGKPVYDFNIAVDGEAVHTFDNERTVQITVDYPLAAGENPDNIVVFYINDSVDPAVLEEVAGIYDAETGKVTFSVDHFSKYTAMHVSISFADMEEAMWAKKYIEALAARKIVNGTGDHKFAPNANITRAQFIQMLMNSFGLADQNAVSTFKDVQSGTWYYSAIATAQKMGITNGMGDGTFGVNQQITRQEMAVLASRIAALVKLELPKTNQAAAFADGRAIASYAKDAVSKMQQAGIINGVGGNKFAPDDHATRAQAAKILYELYVLRNKPISIK